MRNRRFALPCSLGVFKPLWMALALCAVFGPLARGAEDKKPEAKLEVSGYGIFGNRELKKLLELLLPAGDRPEFLDANFIEDAALMIISRVNRDGYLLPVVRAELLLENGETEEFEWDEPLEDPLPRPLKARKAHFIIENGTLFYYKTLKFSGLESVSEKEAKRFFVETGGLIPTRQSRIFTPDRLERSARNLREALERLGYQEAEAAGVVANRDDRTGEVEVEVAVKQGRRFYARSLQVEIEGLVTNAPVVMLTNQPFSRLWEQDLAQALKTTNYHEGYPDTTVSTKVAKREDQEDRVDLDIHATVNPGPRIRMGEAHFEGHKRTKQSVLDRRVDLEQGAWLDRIRAEQGRYRLARLGVFDSVEMRYESVDENTRNVIYRLQEGKEIDFSLLAGYGSYEMLRGGVEVEQYNVFGRGHHARLRLTQSLKSSNAEYTYTMPEFIGEEVDVFFNAFGLRREETSFVREEFGGGMGATEFFEPIFTEMSIRYNYQVLSASDRDAVSEEGLNKAGVGAIITDIRHDRRDNPLYPKAGYKVFANIELASEYLAGDVDYQRVEVLSSYHQPLDEGRWMHFGLSHGFVATLDGPSKDLPFNRRFFPGGESSIRGYQLGEAAPRDGRGNLAGAETYTTLNIEFEQALTPAWSVVAFSDSIGFARELGNYPFDETLFSVGGGLRWRTLIGPVRVEYGHNLNPRDQDPSGTLHFSIGFPF